MKPFYGVLIFLIHVFSMAYGQQRDSGIPRLTGQMVSNDPNRDFVKIKRELNEAIKQNNKTVAARCYEKIGELFYDQAAYSQSLVNYYKADVIYRKEQRTELLAGNLNKIGKTYYYNRQYHVALEMFQQALDSYKTLNNIGGIAESYGYIGQTYEKTGDHKLAFKFQELALKEFRKSDHQTGIAKIYENLGSIYEDRLQLDSALKYFTLALDLNADAGNRMAQIEIVNNIGDVYRKTNMFKPALINTQKAAAMAKDMNEQYQLASAYRDLSKTFELMGRHDSAYYYSEAGRNIFMDIFSQDNKKQLTLLQTLFETEQKDNAIQQFEKDKRINTVLTVGAVMITILVVLLGVSIISRQRLKIRNEQKLNEQNQVLYAAQKKAMEGDLELKSKELTSHTLHLIQKNQLLEELKSKLTEMIKDDKRDQRKELKQVINLITFNNNQEKNWDDFRIIFERVYENFFESLKKHSKTLTASELRLVALLKMNLSSSDIATMLGISQDSLRISRYRLRKKLNLEEGENLSAFLQQL